MKRIAMILLALVLFMPTLALPLAQAEVSTITPETIGGPILRADYPSGQSLQSFEGEVDNWYLETLRYDSVNVQITCRRCSRFTGALDEILEVSDAYGEITKAEFVKMKTISGAQRCVHLRFTCQPSSDSGPKRWIVDVVKVYLQDYSFMFIVARDSSSKKYAKKVDALIGTLRIGDGKDWAVEAESAPADAATESGESEEAVEGLADFFFTDEEGD